MVDKVAAAVRVSIPPYPLEPKDINMVEQVCPNIGIPIRGIPEGKDDRVYFFEVMADGDELVHCIGTGVIADVVGVGDDCRQAFEEPYQILEELSIPNKQYRTDLPKCLEEMLNEVEEQEKVSVGESR